MSSHANIPHGNTPHSSAAQAGKLLAEVEVLQRRTRAARQAYWLPLLLFGLLTVAAAPWYVESMDPAPLRAPRQNPALTGLGGDFLEHSAILGWYWLAALLGGYLLSLGWYRWHARVVGVQTPTRPYLIAGLVGVVAGLALPLVLRFLVKNAATQTSDATRWATEPILGANALGMFPHLVIAAGLIVLARLERSRRLLAVAAGYAAAVLLVNVYFSVAQPQAEDLNRFSYLMAALAPAPILVLGGLVALIHPRTRTS